MLSVGGPGQANGHSAPGQVTQLSVEMVALISAEVEMVALISAEVELITEMLTIIHQEIQEIWAVGWF